MRRGVLVMIVCLGPSCGDPPRPSQAELDGLLQRLDAMEQRVDELEDALAEKPPASDRPASDASRVDATLGPVPRLPRADLDSPPSLRVNISVDGLTLGGTRMSDDEAAERFREIAREAPDTRLVVLAEPAVAYPAIVALLDLAREAGLTDISMTARVHEEAPAAGSVTRAR